MMKAYIIIVTYILYDSTSPHLVSKNARKKINTYALRHFSSIRNNIFFPMTEVEHKFKKHSKNTS